MRILKLVAALSLSMFAGTAQASVFTEDVIQKVLDQGVPADALKRLSTFLDENQGRSFSQNVYSCKGKDPESIRPCEEKDRTATVRDVTLTTPEFVAIIDFSKASTDKRLFFISTKSGEVTRYYATHGVGTSRSNYASRFSNTKDSRQTSLGFYLGGGVYSGHYGNTLRMYGLQTSNDQAYNRDIVLHGAWYVSDEFINSINPKTKQPFGRIGHSWGCPAVSLKAIDKLVAALKNGGVIYHYHPRLMEVALKGQEVIDPEQPFMSEIPLPIPRPDIPATPENAGASETHAEAQPEPRP